MTRRRVLILLLGFAGAESVLRTAGSPAGRSNTGLHVETGAAAAAAAAAAGDDVQIGSSAGRLSFATSNEYPPVEWSPWPHLAEPYKETSMRAVSTIGEPHRDLFMWMLEEENGAIYEGRYVHAIKWIIQRLYWYTEDEAASRF